MRARRCWKCGSTEHTKVECPRRRGDGAESAGSQGGPRGGAGGKEKDKEKDKGKSMNWNAVQDSSSYGRRAETRTVWRMSGLYWHKDQQEQEEAQEEPVARDTCPEVPGTCTVLGAQTAHQKHKVAERPQKTREARGELKTSRWYGGHAWCTRRVRRRRCTESRRL